MPAPAPLTDAEIQEIKQRLGYGALTVLAFPYLQTALVFEQVVKGAVNDYGISRLRDTVLPNLRTLEQERFAARARFKVLRVEGEVQLDPNESRRYVEEESRWLDDLAAIVRVARVPPPARADACGVELY